MDRVWSVAAAFVSRFADFGRQLFHFDSVAGHGMPRDALALYQWGSNLVTILGCEEHRLAGEALSHRTVNRLFAEDLAGPIKDGRDLWHFFLHFPLLHRSFPLARLVPACLFYSFPDTGRTGTGFAWRIRLFMHRNCG